MDGRHQGRNIRRRHLVDPCLVRCYVAYGDSGLFRHFRLSGKSARDCDLRRTAYLWKPDDGRLSGPVLRESRAATCPWNVRISLFMPGWLWSGLQGHWELPWSTYLRDEPILAYNWPTTRDPPDSGCFPSNAGYLGECPIASSYRPSFPVFFRTRSADPE